MKRRNAIKLMGLFGLASCAPTKAFKSGGK